MIDINKRIIKGKSGTIYRIDPENISAGRWQHYMILSTTLGLGVSFQDVFNALRDIYTALTKGNDILGGIKKVITICETYMKFIDRYKANDFPKIVEFCALFCNEDGEELGEFNDALITKKFEDWKHIPIKDFFLLANSAIPAFSDAYKWVVEEEESGQMTN